jgi:hypothetical protein
MEREQFDRDECHEKKPAAGQQPPGFIPELWFRVVIIFHLHQGNQGEGMTVR